ncbi:MAG: hypothetical protein AAF483_18575 [Planctomycetota bacterium]
MEPLITTLLLLFAWMLCQLSVRPVEEFQDNSALLPVGHRLAGHQSQKRSLPEVLAQVVVLCSLAAAENELESDRRELHTHAQAGTLSSDTATGDRLVVLGRVYDPQVSFVVDQYSGIHSLREVLRYFQKERLLSCTYSLTIYPRLPVQFG